VPIKEASQKRSAIVFPKHQKVLEQFGENIKLACKRRGYTQLIKDEVLASVAQWRSVAGSINISRKELQYMASAFNI
jgi:hypothetical protein